MSGDLLVGVERRRRWTDGEKLAVLANYHVPDDYEAF